MEQDVALVSTIHHMQMMLKCVRMIANYQCQQIQSSMVLALMKLMLHLQLDVSFLLCSTCRPIALSNLTACRLASHSQLRHECLDSFSG